MLKYSTLQIISLTPPPSILGSFMFMAIEGDVAMERKANVEKTRNDTATRLWEISCCEYNVFNETFFMEA